MARAAGTPRPAQDHAWFAAFAAAALYAALMALCYPYRGVFAFDPDEGISAMWARLVAHGDALYTQIWINQPPLFPHTVRWWCTAFGWQVDTGRMLVLLFAAAGVFALYDVVRVIASHAAAALACFLLTASAYFPRLSVSLMQGVPSLALAMLALWALVRWQGDGRRRWIAASAVLMAGSLACKLSSAILLPPFVVWLLLCARRTDAGGPSWRPAAHWLLYTLGATAALLLLLVGPGQLSALVDAHLTAQHAPTLARFGWGGMALTAWAEWPLTILGAAGDALVLYWCLPSAAVFPLWAAFAAAGMLVHVPFWYHHQLLLSVPNCAAGAIAVVELFRRDAGAARLPARGLVMLRVAVAALVVALPVWTAVGARLPAPTLLAGTPERILTAMRQLAPGAHVVVTDHPMYAFRFGAIVPPGLAALPLLRVATDPHLADEVRMAFTRRAPELVVLTPGAPPELVTSLRAAMADHYRLAFEQAGTEVFVRSLAAPAEGRLDRQLSPCSGCNGRRETSMPHKETEMAKWILSAALLLVTSVASADGGIACGDAVASHETGVLSDDLTCDQSPGVLLEPEGRLDLRGHTIALRGDGAAIECIGGGCMIFSTSTDRAAIALDRLGDSYGVRAEGADPSLPALSVQNVDISGGRSGIYAPGANVEINVVSVSDASESGIVADDLRAFNVAATGNGRAGLSADTVDIDCATIATNRSADVVSVDSAPSLGPYVTCGSSVDGLDGSAQSWNACPSER